MRRRSLPGPSIALGLKVAIALMVVLLPSLPPLGGLSLRYNPALTLLLTWILLYPALRWADPMTSLGVTLVLFLLPLVELWHGGASEYPVVLAGLFPLTDGSDYYTDAQRLLAGGRFDAISSGRPLFAGALAVLLKLTQGNLQLTLALLTGMVAIAVWLLALEVHRSHGTSAAVVLVAVLLLFYQRFNGTTWTEQWGLVLGAIATALLWRSALFRNRWLFLGGVLLLTLALNARAGTLFVLPALMLWGSLGGSLWGSLWGSRLARHSTSPFSRWMALLGGVAVALGFGLNHQVLTWVGRSDVAFSNFSYILYAQVVGSRDWRQIRVDYPEILTLDHPIVTQRMYELAWQEFLRDPSRLVRSSLQSVLTFLSPTAEGIFGFTSVYGITLLSTAITIALFTLFVVGLVRCGVNRHHPMAALLLLSLTGMLISLPVVPPWIDGVAYSMRLYAATLPLIALVLAIALSPFPPPMAALPSREKKVLPVIALLLLILTIAGPIAVQRFSPFSPPSQPACLGDRTSALMQFHPRATLRLVAPDAPWQPSLFPLPQIRADQFRAGVETVVGFLARRQSKITAETRELLTATSGDAVTDTLDLERRSRFWVILPASRLPAAPAKLHLCGVFRHQVFRAETLVVASP